MTHEIPSIPSNQPEFVPEAALIELLELQEALAEKLNALFIQIFLDMNEASREGGTLRKPVQHLPRLVQIQRGVERGFLKLERAFLNLPVSPKTPTHEITKPLQFIRAFQVLSQELKIFTEALKLSKPIHFSAEKEAPSLSKESKTPLSPGRNESPAAEAKAALNLIKGKYQLQGSFTKMIMNFEKTFSDFKSFISELPKSASFEKVEKEFKLLQKELKELQTLVQKGEKGFTHNQMESHVNRMIGRMESLLIRLFEEQKMERSVGSKMSVQDTPSKRDPSQTALERVQKGALLSPNKVVQGKANALAQPLSFMQIKANLDVSKSVIVPYQMDSRKEQRPIKRKKKAQAHTSDDALDYSEDEQDLSYETSE